MTMFTLEEARALLPEVREVTQHYYDMVEELRDGVQDPEDTVEVQRFEHRIHMMLQEWATAVKALGVEVKGLWVADFDSGDGYYYCWKLGEDDIEHFHHYDTGFAGRRPITLLE